MPRAKRICAEPGCPTATTTTRCPAHTKTRPARPTRDTAARDRHRARIAKDKPACHICGQPIDYTLHYLNPKAFVIDHVIPLTKGGPDTLTNIKAAHRDCNSKKRARTFAPIVRRSGSLD